MIVRRRGRRRSAGQAMVEMALIFPLMILLFAGGFSMTEQITDTQLVNVAVGQATRYAAQLGNYNYSPASISGCQTSSALPLKAKDPCAADAAILGTLRPLLAQMTDVTINEIDIYQPNACVAPGIFTAICPPDQAYTAGANRAERYNKSGVPVGTGYDAGKGGYTLDLRNQAHPNETSIGISVNYTYSPPSHLFGLTLSQFAAYRLEPNT